MKKMLLSCAAALAVMNLCGQVRGPGAPVCGGTLSWSQGGNTVATAPESFLGTCNLMDLRFGTNGSEWMRITPAGKIGFGTSAPVAYFHVSLPASFTSFVGIGTTSPTVPLQVDGGNMMVRGTNNFSLTNSEAIVMLGDANHFIKSINSKGVKIGTYGVTEGIFLQQNTGNVGIGTDLVSNTANFKLSVNGNIRAKKVVVETGWADFVFDKNYKLRSLEETERFINSHGHLPEIPSAAVIETEGVDLGELVKLQMQKIEELTLYIIEQNKRIAALENK
jgi:hypothetical protein